LASIAVQPPFFFILTLGSRLQPLDFSLFFRLRLGLGCRQIRLVWGTKFMERFGNSALQFSLPRRSQTKAGAFSVLAFSIQPLAFVSAAGRENVAEIIGKFGGADQLRNAINQRQSDATDSARLV